jgi:hypothetical protein
MIVVFINLNTYEPHLRRRIFIDASVCDDFPPPQLVDAADWSLANKPATKSIILPYDWLVTLSSNAGSTNFLVQKNSTISITVAVANHDQTRSCVRLGAEDRQG